MHCRYRATAKDAAMKFSVSSLNKWLFFTSRSPKSTGSSAPPLEDVTQTFHETTWLRSKLHPYRLWRTVTRPLRESFPPHAGIAK